MFSISPSHLSDNDNYNCIYNSCLETTSYSSSRCNSRCNWKCVVYCGEKNEAEKERNHLITYHIVASCYA